MYYEKISDKLKSYFKILSPEFPEWLNEYIDTPAMLRIGNTSIDCGCDYTSLMPKHEWYSNLDHSVGVALIIWNFTKDKKQTLAGLFHDISTPVFKHCIDFMNGDSEKQESIEEKTGEIIRNSKEIMALLNRDKISVEEVEEYKLYPIADNDLPKLSADRLEYNFCGAAFTRPVCELEDIKRYYNNLTVVKNEYGIDEIAFSDLKIAEEFIDTVSKVWPWWINDADRTVMQFVADMCMSLNKLGYLSINDLYTLSEKEVINKIKTCDPYLADCFKKFETATECYRSNKFIKDKYCVEVKSKRRYLNPLVVDERIYNLSESARNNIDRYMEIPNKGITYLNFNFIPFTESRYIDQDAILSKCTQLSETKNDNKMEKIEER